MFKSLNFKKGFTVVELIIVVAIVIILAAFVISSLSKYREEQTLRTEAFAIVSVINDARSKTLASIDSSAYGIHLEDDSVTVFKGNSYSLNDPDNIIHNLPSNLEIGSITINGGDDIVFERLTGGTSNTGSFQIMRVSDNSASRVISVVANGQVNLD